MPAPAQLARRRHEHEEGDARRAQVSLAREVVLPVRVDQRGDLGQALVGLVVVDDDHVDAEAARGGERFEARRAAIDGDDEARALGDEPLDGGDVGPVTLEDAVGDVDARGRAVVGEEAREQRGGAGAVDVVIAEHGDALAAFDGVGEPRGGAVHVAQRARVRHQRLERGIEEHRHVDDGDAARGEHAPEQFGECRGAG